MFALTANGIYLTSLQAFTGWFTAIPTGDFRAATADMQVMKYYFFGNNVGATIDLITSQIGDLSLGGISGGAITSALLYNGFVFVGTETGGVFRAELSTITSVEDKNNLPDNFSLSQNYPNPFNPSTTIKYSIPSVGEVRRLTDALPVKVTLKVYDILGREVATLVNEEQAAGNYNYQFSISNLPAGRQGYQLSSGIYFYTLKAGSFSETKKMILLR